MYQPSASSSTINANPRSNLVRQVLEQGQRLRAAMIQTILSQEPMSANVLCNTYNKEILTPITGPSLHAIDNIIEPIHNISHGDRTKFLSFLRGEKMSLAEEQEVLNTFRSMSNSDIYELTERAKQSGEVCNCDTCKAYQSTVENKELQCDIVHCSRTNLDTQTVDTAHRCKCDYNVESNPNISCLKYVDSLKVCIHSITLNKEGNTKIKSSSSKMHITYFAEYSIPCDLLKLPVKSRTKVDTGLDSNNVVRMCSKRIIDNAVYFKQISLHNLYNINDVDLCTIDLRFRICSRVPNQKSINVLGFANFNMSSFLVTKNFTCNLELPILLKDNIPIVLGNIRVSLQLGCGKIYFGGEFVEALNNPLEINTLSETVPFEEEESNFCLDPEDSHKPQKFAKSKPKKKDVDPIIVEKLELPHFVRDKPKLLRNSSTKHVSTIIEHDKKACTALVKNDIKTPINAKQEKCAQSTLKQNRILFGFIYISQAQYLESISSSFLSCKPFGHEDLIVSRVVADNANPVFNFQQRIPYVYGELLLNNLRDNYMIIEFWEQIDSNKILIGYSTISLHQFYLAFRNPDIVSYLDRNKLPVIGSDWWEPITDPDTKEIRGQAQILLALGSQIQIDTLLSERGFTEFNVKIPKYQALKSQAKNLKVTCLKNSFAKIDVGVQSESIKMTDKIKDIECNTRTQDILGLLLSQLIDQTSSNNQNNLTPIENGNCNSNNIIPVSEKTKPTTPPKVRSTSELLDSVKTALSVSPILVPKTQLPSNTFDVHIVIKKALHLPTRRKCKAKKNIRGKCAKSMEEVLMPTTYVTFETTPNGQQFVTHIVQKSANPEWNWKGDVKLPANLLTNNQKRIIFKVWKKTHNACLQPNMDLDAVIGFASLDLTVLLAGLPSIEGWFNIVDFSSKCHGQINILIRPLESVSKFIKSSTSATCTSTSCQLTPNSCEELMELGQEPGELLNRALKRKFVELDEITQRLRSRLSDVVGVEEGVEADSDLSNDAFSEQFDKDINTLSIEGDYGHVDFTQEAKLVQLQQVSRTLQEIQSREFKANQRVLSIAAHPYESDSSLLMPIEAGATQDSSTSSLITDSVKTVAQPATPILLKDLDKELVQGKQRIDSLLNKLTLLSNADTVNRHVSGCSVSDVEGSKTSLTETDATEATSQELDIGHLQMDSSSTTTLRSDRRSNPLSGRFTVQARPGPDGEGSSTDT